MVRPRLGLRKKIRKVVSKARHKIRRRIAARRYAENAPGAEAVPAGAEATAVLVRIVGNDLYPRHERGQALTNLRFILENEPEFPNCKKLFVVNRVFDPDEEKKLTSVISQHGQEALVIPFVPREYAETGWEVEPFGGAEYFQSAGFDALSLAERTRQRIWASAPKIRYAMNINGARNAALDAGRARAEWTILLDGNCILTRQSYDRLQESFSQSPRLPYVIIPMQRLESNDAYLATEPSSGAREEPQIAFHASSGARFDERFPYGIRDKVSLFSTLGVPGEWQAWSTPSWMPADRESEERLLYRYSKGAVFRLASGSHGLERQGSQRARFASRNKAILKAIIHLDGLHCPENSEVEEIVMGSLMTRNDLLHRASRQPGGRYLVTERKQAVHETFLSSSSDAADLTGRTLFVGVGAMKAGTSWVSDYLRGHPEVFHSPIKEMNFFNRLVDNPFRRMGQKFRDYRMVNLILEKGWQYPPPRDVHDRLRSLAELSVMKTDDDYLRFFATRIGKEKVFGEICPQYALLPPEGFDRISALGFRTKLLFFMRDPTDRLVSNIQHSSRRSDVRIDREIAKLTPEKREWQRSDYRTTLENFAAAKPGMEMKTFVYETLFNEETLRELCDFLEISYRKGDFSKRVNASQKAGLTPEQKARVREKLDPLYERLAETLKDDRTAMWAW